jgi:glycosyltransferase involved in cell wall biosynthesis
MRILQVAPIWESVPPRAYGGTEAVVHLLCDELVRLGHDVTLWASGDSVTSAQLRACVPRSIRTDDLKDRLPYVWQHSSMAVQDARHYDIIHNHAGEEVMALADLAGVPMLSTTHCNVTPDRKFIWDHYSGYYNTVSWAQKRAMPEVHGPRFAGVAYNGIDVDSFPFEAEKDDYLLFLSRISVEKAPHIAIDVAHRAGRRLIIAGKVDEKDYSYFLSYVAPHIDGDRVILAGEADGVLKRALYKKAYAVLVPIIWEEPFGLVMAEAGACGTPVIAFDRGAAVEIIRDGETGFVVETADEMVEALDHVAEIDPRACRRWIREQFDGDRMALRYLDMYADITAESRKRLPPPAQVVLDPASGVHREAVPGDRVA